MKFSVIIIFCTFIFNLNVYSQVIDEQFIDSTLSAYEKNIFHFIHLDTKNSEEKIDKEAGALTERKSKELLIKSKIAFIRQVVIDKVKQENIIHKMVLIQIINDEYKKRFTELPDDFYIIDK